MSRESAGTSISTVSAEDLTRVSQQTIEQGLQGRSRAPRSPSNRCAGRRNWVLRGISTLLGDQSPLYVVDGVIVADTYVSNGQSQ
jgi:hypothetical protein